MDKVEALGGLWEAVYVGADARGGSFKENFVKTYKPRNKVPLTGLLLSLLLSALGGLLIGFLAFLLAQFFYLLLVFPVLITIVGMLSVHRMLQKTKIHHPLVGAILGLLMGLMICGTYHYAGYVDFQREVTRSIEEEYQVDHDSAARALDSILRDETGSSGFWGFMQLKAGAGESFTAMLSFNGIVFPGFSGFTLRSGWLWLHWSIEAGLIIAGTTWTGFDVAKRPFSESAWGWYGPAKQIGNVDVELMDQFLDQMRANRFVGAGQLVIAGEGMSHPTVEVYVQQCPDNPTSDILLTVKRTYWGSKGRLGREVVLQGEISPEQCDSLLHDE